jgi:hypothetical protein
MTRIKLRYVNEFIDRHGKPRYYFRRPGSRSVKLPGLPGSIEFMDAYQAALVPWHRHRRHPSMLSVARSLMLKRDISGLLRSQTSLFPRSRCIA